MAEKGDDKSQSEFDLSKDESFKKLNENVSRLASITQRVLTENRTLQSKLSEVEQRLENSPGPTKKNTKDDDGDDDDLPDVNDMDQGQLAKFIIGEVKKIVGDTSKSLKEDVENTTGALTRKEAEKEIKAFAEKTPQFWDFAEEIRDIAKENPNLQIKEMYALARERDPDKAKEVDEKVEAAKKEKEGEEGEQDKRPKFGGLTPTSRAMTTGEDDKAMSAKEASEKAWEETMADIDPAALGEG